MIATASPRVYWIRTEADLSVQVEVIETDNRRPLELCPLAPIKGEKGFSVSSCSTGLRALSRAILWDVTKDRCAVELFWAEFAEDVLALGYTRQQSAFTDLQVREYAEYAAQERLEECKAWLLNREGAK